jgi:hypothetical protein
MRRAVLVSLVVLAVCVPVLSVPASATTADAPREDVTPVTINSSEVTETVLGGGTSERMLVGWSTVERPVGDPDPGDGSVRWAGVALVSSETQPTNGSATANATNATDRNEATTSTVTETTGQVAEATGKVRPVAGDVHPSRSALRNVSTANGTVTDGGETESGAGGERTIVDSDGDGLADGVEKDRGSDPKTADTDGDGLDDGIEVHTYSSDPTAVDSDGDGLTDGREIDHGTDPTQADTDGDGLADGAEVDRGTSPTAADTDGDGLDDGTEVNGLGTLATEADTDGDGLDDGTEIDRGTDPLAVDTDGDGLADGTEVNARGTDPLAADSDGDSLSDDTELDRGTDPLAVDSDGDGRPDGTEVVGVGEPIVEELSPAVPTEWHLVGVGVALVVLFAVGVRIGTRWGRRQASAAAGGANGVARKVTTASKVTDGAGGGTVVFGTRLNGDSRADEGPLEVDVDPSTDDGPAVSDEERVLRLLSENGGRLPQSDIVETTGWSKAKVSRRLSRMDETGRVRKIRLGRRNLIALPGAEPDGAGRPTDHPVPG